MNVAKHISEDDLALFALALMQPEEAAFTLAHLKHCDLCRAEVARMQGDLVAYAMTAESAVPAPEARERLTRAVAKEKKFYAPPPQPAVEPVFAPRSGDLLNRTVPQDETVKRRIGVFGWTGWAIAAGLTALAGWQFFETQDLRSELASTSTTLQHQVERASQPSPETARAQQVLQTLTDPTALQVALQVPATPGSAKPEGHAAYSSATGNLVFIGTHLRRLDEGKTYELWLLRGTGETPLPAGLFKPDANGNASVLLPQVPKNVVAKGFGVTVEDEGGSEKPTPPIVLAGT